MILPFQTRKKCQNYLDLSKLPRPPNFFSNRKVSKLPKPSLSITYHQSFNKSNLLVKNIGFRRNLTFCCISVQIFNSLNRLKLIFVGFTRKSEKSGQYYWSSSRISSKSVKITQTPWYFSNGQKVSKLRGPVKITRTQDYTNPTVILEAPEQPIIEASKVGLQLTDSVARSYF